MAKKICALCGYEEKGLFSGILVEQVNESYFNANNAACTHVLPIKGAPLNIGFCTHNGCAEKIATITHFMYQTKKLHTMTRSKIGHYELESPADVRDAVNYCKLKMDAIPDPAVKAEVQRYVSLTEEALAEREANTIAVREAYQKLKSQAFDFRSALSNPIQFSTSDGTWLACDGTFLYIDYNTDKNLLDLKNNEADIVTRLCYKNINAKLAGYSDEKAQSYKDKGESEANALASKSIFSCARIPLENIVYFKEVGQVEHLTKISGGEISGGGVNWDAAAKGAYWLGAAGLIVGSQMGTEIKQSAIKTDIETIDSRKVSLLYKSSAGSNKELFFTHDCYNFFMQVMSHKEFSIVNLEAQKSEAALPPKQESTGASSFEEIKKFKDLLDCGIITEEEFAAKKKELLGL